MTKNTNFDEETKYFQNLYKGVQAGIISYNTFKLLVSKNCPKYYIGVDPAGEGKDCSVVIKVRDFV